MANAHLLLFPSRAFLSVIEVRKEPLRSKSLTPYRAPLTIGLSQYGFALLKKYLNVRLALPFMYDDIKTYASRFCPMRETPYKSNIIIILDLSL